MQSFKPFPQYRTFFFGIKRDSRTLVFYRTCCGFSLL